MEYLIAHLPITFCLFSGILAAWGIQVAACLFNIIFMVTQVRAHPRSVEVLQFTIVLLTTITLFVLLFFTTSFASFHMSSIVFAEIWYAMFLFFITSSSFSSEMQILQTFNEKPVLFYK